MKYVFLLILLISQSAYADFFIVVNQESKVPSLKIEDITDLYLGRKKVLGTVYIDQVLDRTGEERARFFAKVAQMRVSQVNAYWARLKFSGSMRAPERISSTQVLINKLRQNPQAIGYMVEPPPLDSGVKVALKIDE